MKYRSPTYCIRNYPSYPYRPWRLNQAHQGLRTQEQSEEWIHANICNCRYYSCMYLPYAYHIAIQLRTPTIRLWAHFCSFQLLWPQLSLWRSSAPALKRPAEECAADSVAWTFIRRLRAQVALKDPEKMSSDRVVRNRRRATQAEAQRRLDKKGKKLAPWN